MGNASYATGILSTSPSYGGIGWLDFTGITLAVGVTVPVSTTLKDGTKVSFNLLPQLLSGGIGSINAGILPLGTAQALGNTGYTGVSSAVKPIIGFSSNGNGSLSYTLSNIVVTDPFGVAVANYYFILGDGEATTTVETSNYTTNGGNWVQLANLPAVGGGSSVNISGVGTTSVTLSGTSVSANFNSYVVYTKNPTQIVFTVNQFGGSGYNSAGFAVAIDKVSLNKVINNRFFSNDQFNLAISGSLAASTITYGSTYGAQPVSAYVFGSNGNSFTLNETMATGSSSTLSQYTKTIQYTNLSAGGTIVPASNTLPGNITLALGDIIVATITNSIMPVTITSSKTVSQNFANKSDTLTYTVVLNNTGTISANNVVFIDTIPNGTTFIPNTLTQDGVSISGNPSPPSGVNIGSIQANTTTTLTFQVTINNTIPNTNPIPNTATGNFTYAILPTTGVSGFNTNTTSTKVNSAILTATKIVNKTLANIGDILTYTIPIYNSGNATASNILFIDTIPNGTSLVAASLKQDGTAVSGSPNAPGVTLPNSIGINKITTITFQVKIDTVPNPNPIPNTATAIYTFTLDPSVTNGQSSSINTNTVNTQVNFASLSGVAKYVDKSYATCGDIITYTIVAPNSGTVTAQNVVFKDTIPNGTVLVSNSVFVNGVQQSTANLNSGVTIPNIAPGATATLTFSVLVQC